MRDLPPFREFHDGDQHAFLVHLVGVGAEAAPADVDDMRGAGEEPDVLGGAEDGRGDGEVMQVAGAEPGIVGQVDIAVEDVLAADLVDEMPDAFGHGVDVTRGAGDGLRHHAPLHVEETGGEVACLADRGGEGGADQGCRLFLDHGDEAVPHDLEVDLADHLRPPFCAAGGCRRSGRWR